MTDEPLRLVLFDCDGTIVDSMVAILDACHRSFDDAGLPRLPDDLWRPLIGLPMPRQLELLLPGAPEDLRSTLEQGYRRHRFGTEHADEKLFPGMAELLGDLDDAGCLLGMATSKSRQGLDIVLDRFALRRLFVTLQTGDRHPSKPHPAMVEAAMAAVGAQACATTLVGDTTFDIEMAVHAGVRPIGVTWGHHTAAELERAGAEAVVDSVAALRDLLVR